MRHILRAILTLSVVMALTAAALPIAATPGEEAEFITLINQSRAAAGLGALTNYADLTDDARVHTADMIAAGQVYHSTAAQLACNVTSAVAPLQPAAHPRSSMTLTIAVVTPARSGWSARLSPMKRS